MDRKEYLRQWRAKNKDYMVKWKAAHPEAVKAIQDKWTDNNRQKTRDLAKAYYDKNKDAINERRKLERAEAPKKPKPPRRTKEQKAAYQRDWIAKYREKKRAYSRKSGPLWRKRHPEKAKLTNAESYQRRKEKVKESAKRWREANRHLRQHYNAVRRAKKFANGGEHTYEQWIAKVIECEWLCFYCEAELTIEDLTKDHFFPLSRGGGDEIENVVPACLACNCSKAAMTGPEFIQYRKMLLSNKLNPQEALET